MDIIEGAEACQHCTKWDYFSINKDGTAKCSDENSDNITTHKHDWCDQYKQVGKP